MLIQLAVLGKRASDGKWQSRPITIQEFVDWLRGRYGILIDRLGVGSSDDEQVNRALAANLDALKTRLRQLGFFTDLSDASNSQVITPRFQIAE
jgi:lantibiotic modifying enzyme